MLARLILENTEDENNIWAPNEAMGQNVGKRNPSLPRNHHWSDPVFSCPKRLEDKVLLEASARDRWGTEGGKRMVTRHQDRAKWNPSLT